MDRPIPKITVLTLTNPRDNEVESLSIVVPRDGSVASAALPHIVAFCVRRCLAPLDVEISLTPIQ